MKYNICQRKFNNNFLEIIYESYYTYKNFPEIKEIAMCGIIGYIGSSNAYNILINGLKKLEYRGYDSAGISMGNNGKLKRYRVIGKVSALEQYIAKHKIEGTIGIAHTRWATHGKPSVKNAHPHTDCTNKIHIVHNGIIENHAEIKEFLKLKGHRFSSQTDSEVIAHLIEEYQSMGFNEAVKKALGELEGAFGIAVINQDEPDKLIIARRGSPMVFGIGSDGYIIASDTQAMNSNVSKVIFLQDNELVIINREGYEHVSIEDKPIKSELHSIEIKDIVMDKKGYEHYMLKEIFEQPETIQNAIKGRIDQNDAVSKLGGLEDILPQLKNKKRIMIVSCGTSYYAGLFGRYIFEKLTNLSVEVELASEFRYRYLRLNEDDIVLAISQSGETADTIGAIKEAKRRGALVLGIVNVVGSSISRLTDAGVYNHAGPEIGVASTKLFTSQCVILLLMALLIGRQSYLSYGDGLRIIRSIRRLPMKIKIILENNPEIRKIAEKYAHYKNFLYIGRMYSLPIALEGALKLKEISYIHAEAYPAGEMKHGPISLIDENFPTVAIVPNDVSYEKTISNIEEIRVRSGKVITIATEGDKIIKKYSNDIIYVPKADEVVQPILSVIPLQLLAYHIANINNREIDKPRNLAKSVTVE